MYAKSEIAYKLIHNIWAYWSSLVCLFFTISIIIDCIFSNYIEIYKDNMILISEYDV